MAPQHEITQLLIQWRGGDGSAMNALFSQVYDELQVMARQQLARMRPGQTLNTTALIHEAYLKLVNQDEVTLQDRKHFFGVTATAMRHILVDYVRNRHAQKRGGGAHVTSLTGVHLPVVTRDEDLITLDQALTELGKLNERLVQVVEMRFFSGMTIEEIAELFDISPRTVRRDWRKARAFLHQALSEEDADETGDA